MRGLAILLVLWHHMYMQPAQGLLAPIYELNHAAWVGVDLFFVLSGFLITGILFDSIDRDDFFRRFYMRRTLRIFPLYYGVLLLMLAVTIPLHLHWNGRQWILLSYLQNVGLREPFVYDISNWISLNHFWSLAVEEQYYLVWPLVVWMVRDKLKLVWIALGASAVSLILRMWMASHVNASYVLTSTPARADTLLLGSALALITRSYWRWLLKRYAGVVLALSVLGCLIIAASSGSFEWWNTLVETIGFSLVALACTALVYLCTQEESWICRVFEHRVLRFFGKYSYGLYVWHAFIYAAMRVRLSHRIGMLGSDLLCLSLSIAAALVSYHGFEKWFLRLKNVTPMKSRVRTSDLVAAEN